MDTKSRLKMEKKQLTELLIDAIKRDSSFSYHDNIFMENITIALNGDHYLATQKDVNVGSYNIKSISFVGRYGSVGLCGEE